MDKEIFGELEKSIDSEKKLVEIVKKLKSNGLSQLEVYFIFEEYQHFLQNEYRENDEDTLIEVMALIYGWCPPSIRLFDENLTNEKIQKFREDLNK